MKRNNEIERTRLPEQDDGGRAEQVQEGVHEMEAETAAAVLHSSLLLGEQPMLSGEQSMEAAGMLGNQSVLGLMERGARTQGAFESARAVIDANELADVLSGAPSGPLCDMGVVLGGIG